MWTSKFGITAGLNNGQTFMALFIFKKNETYQDGKPASTNETFIKHL